MSRTLVRYLHDDLPRWGVQFGPRIAPLSVQAASTGELLAHHWEALWAAQPAQADVDRARVKLLPPITSQQQFICQGVNYRSHVVESGLRLDDLPFNTIFTKSPTCITAADAPVVRPPQVRLLDYEIELGLVLRRDLPAGTQVSPDDLDDWLAGVTIVNDLSARDVQLPQGQFYKGKSFRGFGPVGPGLVLLTPSEWAALARASHAPVGERPVAAGRLLRRDDPPARRHADRAGLAARPSRRRPDRHRHAGGLCRALAGQGRHVGWPAPA